MRSRSIKTTLSSILLLTSSLTYSNETQDLSLLDKYSFENSKPISWLETLEPNCIETKIENLYLCNLDLQYFDSKTISKVKEDSLNQSEITNFFSIGIEYKF